MKVTILLILSIALAGCVFGECRDPLKIPMIPRNNFELAHKCKIDPFKPECSVS